MSKTLKNMNLFGPWKICQKWPQMGPGGFFPTNPDLADILGDTDFDFENFHFLDFLDPKFPDFQVPDFQKSGLGPAWAQACGLGPGLGPWLGPGLGPETVRNGFKRF